MTRTDDLGVPTWMVYAFLFLLSFASGMGLAKAERALTDRTAIETPAPSAS